ncbi:flagellar filament capping protein FliD [Sphingopyxis terrae]|jgi:flagellar hook-associated protein 2|uniref:flagellar filament capping protein FliD n=1 Tax=Sphingopyxis terrae TaxID=33052 RepID=UPI003F80F00B
MALTSIASSLGAGSGIDIPKLVDDLAAASREPKVTRLSTLAQQNQARISAVSQARSNLEGFADSLAQMVSDGTLRSTPTVSDESVISATTRAGVNADSFSATVVVDQLARAQTAYSAVVADKTAAIGTGTMTLSVGGTDHVITIDGTNNSLEGLAKAINASGSGVSASIVSDTGGSRIVLKGATGAANSFTLTADAGADPALAAFGYGAGGGMTLGQSATDAQFTIDGVAYSRSSNIVDDVIPGMSLTLKKASPGQEVDVGASRPLDMIRQTVKDFVDVYNQLKKSITDAAAMSGDTRGLRELEGQLRGMMSQTLTSSGTYTTLADIGIYTNKDGLLAVDQTRLETALTTDAGAVEALFNPPRDGAHTDVSDPGIAGVLDALRDKAVGTGGVIDRVTRTLDAKSKDLADQLDKVNEREDAYRARLEKKYSTLDAKLAAFKATQAYLEQQIQMWNNQNSNN